MPLPVPLPAIPLPLPLSAPILLLLLLLLPLLPTASSSHPSPDPPGFHLLNLTHIPISTTGTNDMHNGSISFTLAAKADNTYASHECAHAFVAPADARAAGGPFACSDAWPDLLFYWREGGDQGGVGSAGGGRGRGTRGEGDEGDGGEGIGAGAGAGAGAGGVVLEIWYAYLDCRPNGGAVSESGSLTLPPPTSTGTFADGSRTWDVVHVPIQTASSTAWFPGQYEEVCLGQ
ncbi:uncharacterized protein BKCO1_4700063 [Diplodia corticola]|uniref:Uncharacterized protein n=1 Tax=Diplodia corticola TaxID=236234 RepID=A0A1J9QRC9_9PEZI|nr:uncharacterized protein BKCO1_4700063 [Diplodia corticola]OJD31502.1 hypothetical protein BKCO1_4700063 [Diplodia corticola]